MSAWALSDYHGDVVSSALAEGLHERTQRFAPSRRGGSATSARVRYVGELEGVLSDSNDEVREMAIWGIGQTNVKSAPPLVVNALTDNTERIRVIAAWALGEIADPSTANAIVKAFQTETSSQVRQAELRALGEMGKVSQAVLDVALKSSDPELRRRAVAALAGE